MDQARASGGTPPGPAWVGPAQIFASHAWKYQFTDAVDALALWHGSKLEDDEQQQQPCFVWFDIATVPQHPHKQLSLPPDYVTL